MRLLSRILHRPRLEVTAHCDLPCGVYDPAQARIEAESVKGIQERYQSNVDPESRSRALEIIINVVLPVAGATGEDQHPAKARALYGRLPRPATYGVPRFPACAPAPARTRVPSNSRRAQGLHGPPLHVCTAHG